MKTLRFVLCGVLCLLLAWAMTPVWAEDTDVGDDSSDAVVEAEAGDDAVVDDAGEKIGETEETPPDSGTVTEVNDDGTITLDSGETVRLLGVDIDEAGEAAILFLSGLLVGNAIDLYYDEVIYDDSDVLMGYVYLPGGTCVNVEVVTAGYGMAYGQYPCSELEYYWELECQAREQKMGMWSSEERRTRRETEFEGFGGAGTSSPVGTDRTLDSTPTTKKRDRDMTAPTATDRTRPDIEPKKKTPSRHR
ncbi:MAG: thermonuclease family protein [Deltaproteobacteria bacterium]|nr:thermonuclease family protein [Candidatus Zymogenaceae bacterium]